MGRRGGGRRLVAVGFEAAGGLGLGVRRWSGRGRSRSRAASRVGSIGCSRVAGSSLAWTGSH